MSGSNPFRVRRGNPDPLSTNTDTFAPVLPSKPLSTPPIAPNHHRKSSVSLEHEIDDSSSSDEEINPFNPVSTIDTEDEINGNKSPAPREDDRPESFGSAPHPAPSTDGSPISSDHNMRSATGVDSSHARPTAQLSPELNASPPGRAKDKKPPPPPKSHHGRRIGSTATAESSQTARSRSTNRLSIHGYGNVTPGALHHSSVSLSSADYFSVPAGVTGSTDSLQRSQSQHKRPPTPPLSRRHSQMRRSKSTQSKTSSRLTMSYGSESNDSSLPPSPGPSSRELENKRISMPPPSSGDFQATTQLGDISLNLSPPTNSRPSSLKAGRRASSYGSVPGGSTGPPPPPPPRRTRDPIARSDVMGLKENQTPAPATTQAPQPSNALDILADLTRLQKEVDDLRGHYENRKVSD